ncbi:MAG TPA: sugar ABC transporter substrate-binding protein [Rudaea sp.]
MRAGRIARLLTSALACAVAMLAGCARDAGVTTIRFMAMGREAEVVSGLIAQFEKENPGIRVDVQQIPWTAAHEKLLTAFAADALPDLCQLGNTWLPEFATLDALEPLQPLVDASKTIVPSDYFPGIWDTNVIDGRLYGVPWYIDTRLLFYRKDILAQAGYDHPPQSWDEWNEQMAAIKKTVGAQRYATMVPLNEFEQLLSLALQQKDPLLRDDNTRGNFESAGFRKALAFYADLFAQGWAPPMSQTQISNVWDEFFNGFYVFYVSGPWNIREFRRRVPAGLENSWTTAPLPGPDGPGAGIAGGTSLVLFRSSQHKAQTWKLVEFLSRPEIQERFHAEIGDPPPRRSTWDRPGLANDPLARAFRDQLERVKPTPKVLEWERIVQEMRYMSERVVRGGQAQDIAVRDLDRRVDDILEKRRWMRARDERIAGGAR